MLMQAFSASWCYGAPIFFYSFVSLRQNPIKRETYQHINTIDPLLLVINNSICINISRVIQSFAILLSALLTVSLGLAVKLNGGSISTAQTNPMPTVIALELGDINLTARNLAACG